MLCVLPVAYSGGFLPITFSGFLPRASFSTLATVLFNKTSIKTQKLKFLSIPHFGFSYMPYGKSLAYVAGTVAQLISISKMMIFN